MGSSMWKRDARAYRDWQADLKREADLRESIEKAREILKPIRDHFLNAPRHGTAVVKAIDDYFVAIGGEPGGLGARRHTIP